jgi:HPt (histidine-containing phosphotransfer) domain-containing protein
MPAVQTSQYVYSPLGSDLDLASSVAMFVDKLPQYTHAIRTDVAHHDWQSLEYRAHQLRGSSHSYGFNGVTQLAAALEKCCKVEELEFEIAAAADDLLNLCDRVRPGAPK